MTQKEETLYAIHNAIENLPPHNRLELLQIEKEIRNVLKKHNEYAGLMAMTHITARKEVEWEQEKKA